MTFPFLKAREKPAGIDRATARREFLALRPGRNPKIEWEETGGKALLKIPRGNNWKIKLVNFFSQVPDHRKVELDAIGSHVWARCDGKNTIEFLSKELQREYKLGAREAELSLQQFFKDLGRRGYVGFVTPNNGSKSKVSNSKK